MVISVLGRRKRSLVFLFILLVAILPPVLAITRPFWTAFIIAAILAIVLHPLKEKLRRRLRRPGLATLLTTTVAVVVLGVILTFAGFNIVYELERLYSGLNRNSMEEGGWPAFATMTLDRLTHKLSEHLPIAINEEAVRAEIMNGMKKASSYLLGNVGIAVSGAANFISNGILITISLYFLLRYGRVWIRKLASLTPLEPPVADNILRTIQNSVTANVNGMLAVIVGQGLLLILGFWFVGVRAPVLWGTIGGFASIIPVVGSLLVWAPVVIGFLLMGAYGKAVILAIWGFVIVGSADNILRPVVVGRQGKQHPVLVALAAIGGVYAFGVLGILLGPVVMVLTVVLVKEIMQLISDDPELKDNGNTSPEVSSGTLEGTSEKSTRVSLGSDSVLRQLLTRRKNRKYQD